ncbi:MAG: transporter, partial [Gillisia sp.]
MKKIIPFMGLIFLCINSIKAQDLWSSGRPDGHSPISIMGDHYHHKGEVMFSYRFMHMSMEGMLHSSDEIGNDAVFANYMASPQKMQMDMHMLGGMYAISDHLTLMAMANYISNKMDVRSKMGSGFTTESSGFGDISLSGLLKFVNANRQSVHGIVGVSLPVGSISEKDDTPVMEDAVLAYPMQLGSGTFDPFFGVTYLGQSNVLSWGFQPKYKFRIGENSENYTLGNRFDAVAWGAVKVSKLLSFSTSLSYYNIAEIKGSDDRLNPTMMPLFNTVNSGRSQLDVGFGSNVY